MERILLAYDEGYEELLARVVDVLLQGGVILYPTDTVYGLGADATNTKAVACIRAIKRRSKQKAILAMVSGLDMVERYGEMTATARALAKAFWPGPLSLVLDARDRCALSPSVCMQGTVCFRYPAHTFCNDVVQRFGRPITSTSANISNTPQFEDLDMILQSFGTASFKIDLVVDGGTLPPSKPSTVIDARASPAQLIRAGAVSEELLADFL